MSEMESGIWWGVAVAVVIWAVLIISLICGRDASDDKREREEEEP
jgi:hypothetical protein